MSRVAQATSSSSADRPGSAERQNAGVPAAASDHLAQNEQLRTLRHSLGNTLYGIRLQLHCAEIGMNEGELAAVRENLRQIDNAVGETTGIVEQILQLTAAGPLRKA